MSRHKFYADYDVVFPKKARHLAKFRQVIDSLCSIADTICSTRFTKKADFYGLFAAALELNRDASTPTDLKPASKRLKKLSDALEGDPQTLTGVPQEYYTTVIEGANKLSKRKLRKDILLTQLQ